MSELLTTPYHLKFWG
ncbi:hypothetical protein Zm00014a_013918 [Zea mays]|uniref:Uncharacterized protein n=1 Tax=Zea mays TaxID=4577 RepID=A0A3L6DC44_MAIZE|nr:hypothetical protein Zm00014a_013918 [Zea mays]